MALPAMFDDVCVVDRHFPSVFLVYGKIRDERLLHGWIGREGYLIFVAHEKLMKPFERIGLVGLILHSVLAAYCIIPIVLYSRHLQRENSNKLLTRNKLAFHYVILSAAFSEIVYYVSIYTKNDYSTWGYSCHLIGVFFGVLASAMVLYFWSILLGLGLGMSEGVRNLIGAVFVGCNAVATLIDLLLWCMYPDKHRDVRISVTVIHVLSLFLLFCTLLRYGYQLKRRLAQPLKSAATKSDDILRRRTLSILRRINFVLLICCISYSLRAVLLSIVTYYYITAGLQSTLGILSRIPLFEWYILALWIPQLVPGVTFLYIMRYHRQPHTAMDPSRASSSFGAADHSLEAAGGSPDRRNPNTSTQRPTSGSRQNSFRSSPRVTRQVDGSKNPDPTTTSSIRNDRSLSPVHVEPSCRDDVVSIVLEAVERGSFSNDDDDMDNDDGSEVCTQGSGAWRTNPLNTPPPACDEDTLSTSTNSRAHRRSNRSGCDDDLETASSHVTNDSDMLDQRTNSTRTAVYSIDIDNLTSCFTGQSGSSRGKDGRGVLAGGLTELDINLGRGLADTAISRSSSSGVHSEEYGSGKQSHYRRGSHQGHHVPHTTSCTKEACENSRGSSVTHDNRFRIQSKGGGGNGVLGGVFERIRFFSTDSMSSSATDGGLGGMAGSYGDSSFVATFLRDQPEKNKANGRS